MSARLRGAADRRRCRPRPDVPRARDPDGRLPAARRDLGRPGLAQSAARRRRLRDGVGAGADGTPLPRASRDRVARRAATGRVRRRERVHPSGVHGADPASGQPCAPAGDERADRPEPFTVAHRRGRRSAACSSPPRIPAGRCSRRRSSPSSSRRLFCLRLRIAASERPERSHLVHELREGWGEFASRTWLWTIVASFGFFQLTLFPALLVLGPLVAKTHLGGARCVGPDPRLPGRWVGGRRPARAAPASAAAARRVHLLCLPIAGLLALLGASAPVAVLCLMGFLAAVGLTCSGILWFTTFQLQVPDHLMSRISSFDWLGSVALNPIGYALIGPLAEPPRDRGNALPRGCCERRGDARRRLDAGDPEPQSVPFGRGRTCRLVRALRNRVGGQALATPTATPPSERSAFSTLPPSLIPRYCKKERVRKNHRHPASHPSPRQICAAC